MITQQEFKAARTRLNLTTKQVAALLDVSESTVQRWDGQRNVNQTIPLVYWEIFQLFTSTHPIYKIVKKADL
ncbi:MAG: hypothetical protein RL755_20 [Pseudomonadota bacterium]|jgi:DNA-binding transcriptional regulator YiaG